MITARHGLLRIRGIAARNLLARSFADNLLGHSPMAESGAVSNESRHIPTAHEAKVSGVWQATTAKRDKLAELKIEAPDGDLDAMATPQQLQDLYLVDGLSLIVKEYYLQNNTTTTVTQTTEELRQWLNEMAASLPEELNVSQVQDLVSRIEVGIAQRLLQQQTKHEELALSKHVREFYDASTLPDFNPDKYNPLPYIPH